MKAGRPLRFLTIAIGGWAAGRTALLWPVAEGVAAVSGMLVPPANAMLARAPQRIGVPLAVPAARMPTAPRNDGPQPHRQPIAGDALNAAPVAGIPEPDRSQAGAAPMLIAPSFLPTQLDRSSSRFAASGWTIFRQGPPGSTAGGQLGGSQLGVRGSFMLDPAHRIAISARLSASLEGVGREAAIGIDWQPLAVPIHLIAERRVALDSGRDGTALLVVAGIGPQPIARRLRVEAYGQAGAVVRDGVERFVDGAARLSYDLGSVAGVPVDAGAGVWGGAQRGAARLDVGPSAGVRVPVAGRMIRLTLDWRHRIADGARPGSGPALSIGSDF